MYMFAFIFINFSLHNNLRKLRDLLEWFPLHSGELHYICLTHLSLASLLWDIGKQNSPRRDAAKRGVPSAAIMFAQGQQINRDLKHQYCYYHFPMYA